MRAKSLEILSLLAACIMVFSCSRSTVMHSYRNVPVEGWDQSDALSFSLDTVREGGVFNVDVGVRTTNDYPYQKLWLAVVAELSNPDTVFADTVACVFADKNGVRSGNGTNMYQYDFNLGSVELEKGQTGKFVVHHIMRREIIPGVSNIGLRLSK